MLDRILEIIKQIIWPSARTVAYAICSMILLFLTSLIFFDGGSVPMYAASILSFYLLALAIANGPRLLNLIRFAIATSTLPDDIRKKAESTKIGKALLEREDAREILISLPGIIGGLAYAIFNLTMGIMQRSVWLACVGVYAMALNSGKIYIVHGMQKIIREDSEHLEAWECRRCRLAGIWLGSLDLVMALMVSMMVNSDQNFDLSGFALYVYAFYAVYSIAFSVANIYIFRFSKSPVRFALKAMNLARALMSLLVLQTTLVGNAGFIIDFVKQFMNAFTGLCVILTTFVMAGVLLWKGRPSRDSLNDEKPGLSWYHKPTPAAKIPHKRKDKFKKKKPTPRKTKANK
ncbi:MAG: hypothetical protein PUE62_07390 [Coriobacteriaceae bacterium]|nr:hypothetical protein [Coriobacteriaceae bacterium]